jgi:hypothetical protein
VFINSYYNLGYPKAAREHVLSMQKPSLATKTFQLGRQMQFRAQYTRIWTPTENEVIDALAVLCRYHNDTHRIQNSTAGASLKISPKITTC